MSETIKLPLEERCQACFGSGKNPKDVRLKLPKPGPCGECDGIGYVPTLQGLDVLEFIKRHLGK